ncbi:MAG: hypothetical protein ACFFD2_09635 [Promethearchaeota archaeon]
MITIHVKEDTWRKLNRLKKPGETMDDVIRKILEVFSVIRENNHSSNKINNRSFDELIEEFCNIANEEFHEIIDGSRRSFQKRILSDKK